MNTIDLNTNKSNKTIIFVPKADDIILWDLWDFSINHAQLLLRETAFEQGYKTFIWLVVDTETKQILETVQGV